MDFGQSDPRMQARNFALRKVEEAETGVLADKVQKREDETSSKRAKAMGGATKALAERLGTYWQEIQRASGVETPVPMSGKERLEVIKKAGELAERTGSLSQAQEHLQAWARDKYLKANPKAKLNQSGKDDAQAQRDDMRKQESKRDLAAWDDHIPSLELSDEQAAKLGPRLKAARGRIESGASSWREESSRLDVMLAPPRKPPKNRHVVPTGIGRKDVDAFRTDLAKAEKGREFIEDNDKDTLARWEDGRQAVLQQAPTPDEFSDYLLQQGEGGGQKIGSEERAKIVDLMVELAPRWKADKVGALLRTLEGKERDRLILALREGGMNPKLIVEQLNAGS